MVSRSDTLRKEKQKKGERLMERLDNTIMAVLQANGAPIHRTKLVKLVYLIDELFYQHFGRTMTGLSYMWDEFGPNAVGNAIVKEADSLANQGNVRIEPYANIYGETSYLYSLEQGKADLAEKVPQNERYVIRDVVAHYRKHGVRDIVRVSKQTEPFKNAEQYSLLKMGKSVEYDELMEAVKSDPDFMKGIEEATQTIK